MHGPGLQGQTATSSGAESDRNVLSPHPEAPSPRSRCGQGRAPSGTSWGIFLSSSGFWGLLLVLGAPWLKAAALHLCLCHHVTFSPGPSSHRHLLVESSQIALGSISHRQDLISANYICRDTISKQGHILRPWVLQCQHIFLFGGTGTHNIIQNSFCHSIQSYNISF